MQHASQVCIASWSFGWMGLVLDDNLSKMAIVVRSGKKIEIELYGALTDRWDSQCSMASQLEMVSIDTM